jgi:hypothetical protein
MGRSGYSTLGVETALLEENERRFNHASCTPFLVPSLYETIGSLGPLASGPVAHAIIYETFQPPVQMLTYFNS